MYPADGRGHRCEESFDDLDLDVVVLKVKALPDRPDHLLHKLLLWLLVVLDRRANEAICHQFLQL